MKVNILKSIVSFLTTNISDINDRAYISNRSGLVYNAETGRMVDIDKVPKPFILVNIPTSLSVPETVGGEGNRYLLETYEVMLTVFSRPVPGATKTEDTSAYEVDTLPDEVRLALADGYVPINEYDGTVTEVYQWYPNNILTEENGDSSESDETLIYSSTITMDDLELHRQQGSSYIDN